MRKGWRITAQRLFATSAISILTALPGTGFSETKAQPVGAGKAENPQFRSECEGIQTALQTQLEFIADTTVSATDITANFVNGKIVLKGNSNQQGTAKKARQIAEKATKLPIKDEIRIWPIPGFAPQKASLETLQKTAEKIVNLELAANYPKLKVNAHKDGTVTVRGPIVSLEDKVEVSKKLRKIPGCMRVENLIEIQPMVHGGVTVQLVSKDGQKYLPVSTKPTTTGMTVLPESWPVFQTVKTADPAPTVVNTGVVAVQPVEKTRKEESPKSQPKDLPGSLNTSKPVEKTPGQKVEPLLPPAPPPVATFESKSPAKLPEFQIPAPAPAQAPAAKPSAIAPVMPPLTPMPVPHVPQALPKVEATPTTNAKSNNPVFQAIPTAKKTAVDKIETPPVTTPKLESKVVEPRQTIGIPQSTGKVWAPAHDPKGNVTIRTDALGYPVQPKEVPLAPARKANEGKIPEQYTTNSDKNPGYDRPYLASKAPTQATPLKDSAKASSPMVAKTQVQPVPLKQEAPATVVAKTAPPKVEAKLASSTKSPEPERKVQPKAIAKPVSNKKETETKVGTGTITFDDEDETPKGINKPNPLHESLRKLALASCKGEVAEVRVTEQSNGKALLTIQMIKGKSAANAARKLFSMPEFSSDKIILDIKD